MYYGQFYYRGFQLSDLKEILLPGDSEAELRRQMRDATLELVRAKDAKAARTARQKQERIRVKLADLKAGSNTPKPTKSIVSVSRSSHFSRKRGH